MKKKKYVMLLIVIVLLLGTTRWMGIGYRWSGSAANDLYKELKALHGEPYTGREVENGTEDMEFSVEPDTFFLTNYNLRHSLGLDYRYKCKVVYTVHSDEKETRTNIITYTGIDPMGYGKEEIRAYLEKENTKE